MSGFLKLRGSERERFLQSKYNYFKKFNTSVIILACLSSTTYFISDCQIFGRFAWETLLPRMFILIPLIGFLIISTKTQNYKIMSILSYLMAHGIMWCTIWAIYFLPDRLHANEGFIIMQLIFIAIAYCTPFSYNIVFHSAVILNIIVSNLWNHYENFNLMLSLGIPCVVAIIATNYVMTDVYLDHYDTKDKLEDALVTDPLTQICNRYKLDHISQDNKLDPLLGTNISFMMIDIDLFKNVNDTYGHESGDVILKHIADTIKCCVRGQDIIIRWGGEEFVIIMPNCPIDSANRAAERIRNCVQNSDNSVCPITVSIGTSQYIEDNYIKSIGNADTALYTAKHSGRNCVVCFDCTEECAH